MSARYDPWHEEPVERQCGADYEFGTDQPRHTYCDLEIGHEGAHQSDSPFVAGEAIEWSGGGLIAGERMPFEVQTIA